MVLGTASNVGKSLIATALCRIFARDGLRVAPFKAQNMSLNAYAVPNGGEIGIAQAIQAEAAGVAPSVLMNPILLKPTSDRTSQIVILGQVWATLDAREYHLRRTDEPFAIATRAFEELARSHDVVVMEGAGSPAEINLKATDIANMRMAQAADATCILVGDIDCGGVFASLLGTLELLEPHERTRIAGFVINKFRGDVALLRPGISAIEERLGIPCWGVIPYLHDLGIEEEDGVARRAHPRRFAGAHRTDSTRPLRVAVVDLPYLANASDFDALFAEPSLDVAYAQREEEIGDADVVILPGTKSTLADLAWLRAQKLDAAIVSRAYPQRIVGICGGMQMLGRAVHDPLSLEGGGSALGLDLLAIETTLDSKKVAIPARAQMNGSSLFGVTTAALAFGGYEIHLGVSTPLDERTSRFAQLQRSDGEIVDDGAVGARGDVFGTYLHGLFRDDRFRHAFIGAARIASGLAPATRFANYDEERAARFDRLADTVRDALDLDALRAAVRPLAAR